MKHNMNLHTYQQEMLFTDGSVMMYKKLAVFALMLMIVPCLCACGDRADL